MNVKELESIIEAILFTMGDAVEADRIAQATGNDTDTIIHIVHDMMDKFKNENRGVQIIELDGAFQMCTKKEAYEYLIKLAHVPKKFQLTDALLETLSVVAYKQPVTRTAIEKIRGVNCDRAIDKLVEYGLVAEAGRLDAPGRPIVFATTEEFLRSFGIQSIDELPVANPEKAEDFKLQAEEEAQMTLKFDD